MPVEAKKHEPFVLRAMISEWKRSEKGDANLIEHWKLREEAQSVYLRCADLEELVIAIGAEFKDGKWLMPFYTHNGVGMMPITEWIVARKEAAQKLATLAEASDLPKDEVVGGKCTGECDHEVDSNG